MSIPSQVRTLPNGLRVAVCPMPDSPSVAIGFWIGVGGRHEPAKQCGVSHFLEHLLFKGTRRRTSKQIMAAIEGCGGSVDAYTQEDLTCIHARVPATHMEATLDILSDMIAEPKMSAADIERERDVILEEIAMYRDQPQHEVDDLLMASLWPDHPVGRSLTGTEQTVKALRASDIRRHKETHYVGPSIVMAVAGPVDAARVMRFASRRLGKISARPAPAPVPVTESLVPKLICRVNRDSDQVYANLGFRLFGRGDRRRYATKLLSVMLGENMSSRLFQQVRDRHGLAYSISSGVTMMSDTGLLGIDAGLDREQAMKGLRLILKELQRFRQRPVPARELKLALDYVIGQLRMGFETTYNQVGWAGEQLMNYGRIRDPHDVERDYLQVSPKDVYEVAREWISLPRASLAWIGPESGPGEKELRRAMGELI